MSGDSKPQKITPAATALDNLDYPFAQQSAGQEYKSNDYFRCPLISFVISNIETWPFLKISFNLASALIMVFLA